MQVVEQMEWSKLLVKKRSGMILFGFQGFNQSLKWIT